jgi:hypothetical protein
LGLVKCSFPLFVVTKLAIRSNGCRFTFCTESKQRAKRIEALRKRRLRSHQHGREIVLHDHRRQLQRKGDFLEFIVPDVLRPYGLRDRYRDATFDRELAIRRSEMDFLALGHPFIDAAISYVGSYDFGGITAIRHISEPQLAGQSGYLFLFVVRQRVGREDGGIGEICSVEVEEK